MERKGTLATATVVEEAEAEQLVVPASADKVDKDLVDRSVKHIREVLAKTVSRGLDEVGKYLLKEFFDDDPEVFFASGPNRHASLRRLIERSDSIELPVSRTFLLNALRVAVVTRGLPEAATFNRLPPSHRVELLRVREPEKVERLATRAVERKLSVVKLRELVQKTEERTKSTRGRKPTPNVLRAIEGCLRLLRDEGSGKLLFRRGDISGLTEEQQARAAAAFKTLDKRVAELRKMLG